MGLRACGFKWVSVIRGECGRIATHVCKMGIRFYCPNGHRLNVKSFLAGKRGICPHCGAKVDIPLDSTRDSGKEKPVEPEQADPNAPKAVPVTGPANAAPTAQPAPVAQPVNATAQGQVPMAQPVGGNQPLPAQPLPAQQPTPATAHPAAAPVAPATSAAAHPAAGMPAMPDPIAEAPQAGLVRSPSIGRPIRPRNRRYHAAMDQRRPRGGRFTRLAGRLA